MKKISKVLIIVLVLILAAVAAYFIVLNYTNSQYMPWIKKIEWAEAVSLIKNCEVTGTGQAHSLWVTLTLKDGSTVLSKEPKIDEVNKYFSDMTACGYNPMNVTE